MYQPNCLRLGLTGGTVAATQATGSLLLLGAFALGVVGLVLLRVVVARSIRTQGDRR